MARPFFSTYLYRQSRSPHFFFRIRIPKWLRRVVSSRELRYTLQTANLTDAKYRAMRLAKTAKILFARMRKGEIMGELTKETLDRMMQEELKKMLEEAEADRAARVVPWTRERLESQEFAMWSLEGDARENLALSDYREISSHVDEFLRENGIEGVEKGSETYGKLCRELLKVRIRFFEIEQHRVVGDYSDDLGEDQSNRPAVASIPANSASVPKQANATENCVPLSQIIREYANEKKRGAWRPKTELENMTSFSLLIEVLGDIPVAEITNGTMREYKQILMKLPPNIRKSPEYRDKSIMPISLIPPSENG